MAGYGKAIRVVRKRHKLRQKDIGGVTPREVRRLENGNVTPHADTLKKLAYAHKMNLAEYLNELAIEASK